VHIIQEDTTIKDMVRTMPRISATLENRQAYHQSSMVEIEGTLKDNPFYILIELGASLSYVTPRIVELCNLSQRKFEKPWLVQLATRTK